MKEKRREWRERKLPTMRTCRNFTESLVSGPSLQDCFLATSSCEAHLALDT